jgi:hypothetical protein
MIVSVGATSQSDNVGTGSDADTISKSLVYLMVLGCDNKYCELLLITMSLKITKISVTLFLSLFCMVSVFSASSYAWCSDDNWHVELTDNVIATNCNTSDNEQDGSEVTEAATTFQDNDAQGDACLDFVIVQENVTFVKQLKSTTSATAVFLLSESFFSEYSDSAKKVATTILTRPSPKLPRSILEHKTIVLLI